MMRNRGRITCSTECYEKYLIAKGKSTQKIDKLRESEQRLNLD